MPISCTWLPLCSVSPGGIMIAHCSFLETEIFVSMKRDWFIEYWHLLCEYYVDNIVTLIQTRIWRLTHLCVLKSLVPPRERRTNWFWSGFNFTNTLGLTKSTTSMLSAIGIDQIQWDRPAGTVRGVLTRRDESHYPKDHANALRSHRTVCTVGTWRDKISVYSDAQNVLPH